MTGAIDSHVHLWNRASDPQPWIEPASMRAIDRDFTPGDLERMLDATGMDSAVVVQSTNSVAETRRLLAHPSRRIAGVVGWVDLTADPGRPLDELDRTAPGRLVGIRHLVHLDPDPAWLAQPALHGGLSQLAHRGLAFDLVVRPWQLPSAALLAHARPDVRFVLDHLGGIADTGDDAGWAAGVRELARCPNTSAKISGLAGLVGADADRLRRVLDVALEAFGARRLMYGSDWPVAELGAGAPAWRAVVDNLIGELGPAERQAILSGTAAGFYRISA